MIVYSFLLSFTKIPISPTIQNNMVIKKYYNYYLEVNVDYLFYNSFKIKGDNQSNYNLLATLKRLQNIISKDVSSFCFKDIKWIEELFNNQLNLFDKEYLLSKKFNLKIVKSKEHDVTLYVTLKTENKRNENYSS